MTVLKSKGTGIKIAQSTIVASTFRGNVYVVSLKCLCYEIWHGVFVYGRERVKNKYIATYVYI